MLLYERVATGSIAVVTIAKRISPRVVLVVVFGRIERLLWEHFDGERHIEHPHGIYRRDDGFSGSFLILARIVDGGRVFGTTIVKGTVGVGRVAVLDEVLHEPRVCDSRWVVGDEDDFAMPSQSVILVCRILARPSGVSGNDVNNAIELLEIRFHAPKASTREYGCRARA